MAKLYKKKPITKKEIIQKLKDKELPLSIRLRYIKGLLVRLKKKRKKIPIIFYYNSFKNKIFFRKILKKKTLKLSKKALLKKNLLQILKKKNFLKLNYKRSLKYKKKKFLKTPLYIRLSINRINIFCTLSTFSNRVLKTISTGRLLVKGKKRNLKYIVKRTANFLYIILKDYKYKYLIYIIKGNSKIKKKKNFFKILRKFRQYKILKFYLPTLKAYNGCRPSKKRRL